MGYTCGDLTLPLTSYVSYEDVFGKLKNKMFRANINSRIYPDFTNYENITGNTLNLKRFGTCYLCTGINWAKWLVYTHTGKKLGFTYEEMLDAAYDLKNYSKSLRSSDVRDPSNAVINGGYQSGVKTLFHYNEKVSDHMYSNTASPLITNFITICNNIGINESNICNSGVTANRDNLIPILTNFGPCWWSHNPKIYSSTNGAHAILIVGYDTEYMYFKGSWSDSDTDHTYKHYGKVSFTALAKDPGLLLAYGPAGFAFKNL